MPGLPAFPVPATGREARAVVVADDDADMRLYLRGCLRSLGFRDIREAADGQVALQRAHESGVALVVSDLRMPGLGGEALCLALHADPTTAAIPILIISGESREPPDCADGFLAKPFNTASLQTHVARLLPLLT